MFKKKLLFFVLALFGFTCSVNAEEWVYQKMYLTSHHVMNYSNDRGANGRANLHVIENLATASSESAGDGETRFVYCADVDTGGYAGTYVSSVLGDSAYNGNGKRLTAILASSYPYVSLEEMKALYASQTGNSIDGLTYQEAIYGTQAAIWTITNSNHAPYTFGFNMDDSDMLDLTHARIGLHCNWSVTDPSAEGYCYPNSSSAIYEHDESVVSNRVNALVSWLLSLDGSEIDGSGDIKIDVVSKEMIFDKDKNKNVVNVSFTVDYDNLTTVSSLFDVTVKVSDKDGNDVAVSYEDGVYSFSKEYDINNKEQKYSISVDYSSTYGAQSYLYESSGNQDLVGVLGNTINKSSNLDVDVTRTGSGDVSISKVAVTGGPELPGAKLTIKDSTGKVIDSWVSTDKVHEVKGLSEGKYTLTEELTPEGYVTATTITFEIKDGEVTSVEMVDEVTKVLISKKDFTTEEEVVGARIQIKDVNGKVVHEWVSSSEPHYIEKLPVGKYTLVEVVYPEGYEDGMIVDGILVSEYEFEVQDTGEIQTIDVYNRAKTVTKITDVPSTGINNSITLGVSVIVIGCGLIIISRKKNA